MTMGKISIENEYDKAQEFLRIGIRQIIKEEILFAEIELLKAMQEVIRKHSEDVEMRRKHDKITSD